MFVDPMNEQRNELKFPLLAGSFQQAVSVLGHIDIVFNNAGLVMENRWEYMIDVNFVSLWRRLCYVLLAFEDAIGHFGISRGG